MKMTIAADLMPAGKCYRPCLVLRRTSGLFPPFQRAGTKQHNWNKLGDDEPEVDYVRGKFLSQPVLEVAYVKPRCSYTQSSFENKAGEDITDQVIAWAEFPHAKDVTFVHPSDSLRQRGIEEKPDFVRGPR